MGINADQALLTEFKHDDGNARYYSGLLDTHSFYESEYVIFFLLLFGVFAFLIYYTTLFAVRRIFGLGLVTDERFIEDAHREVTVRQIL